MATEAGGPFWRSIARLARERTDDLAAKFALGNDVPVASTAQERIWLLDQLEPGGPRWTIGVVLELFGDIDVERLQRALDAIAGRHDTLHTRYRAEPSGRLWLERDQPGLRLIEQDCRAAEPVDGRALALAAVTDILDQGFDLSAAPPVRAALAWYRHDAALLVVALHHIAADVDSLRVIAGDLATIYNGDALPTATPYSDWARWEQRPEHRERRQRDLDHWARILAGRPEPRLPVDHRRHDIAPWLGIGARTVLQPNVRAAIVELARRAATTPGPLVLSALALLLHRWSATDEPVVAMPISNRSPHFAATVGPCTELVAVPLPTGRRSVLAHIADVSERTLDALRHTHAPFADVVQTVAPAARATLSPLFDALYVFRSTRSLPPVAFRGMRARHIELDSRTVTADVVVGAQDNYHGFGLSVELRQAQFAADAPRRQLEWLHHLLVGMLANPDRSIAALAPPRASGSGTRRRPVATSRPAQRRPIHQRVLDAARAQPDALAVADGDRTLTYGELRRAAATLAARLDGAGAGPIVPVCLPAGNDVVVAMLSVTGSGRAFFPLDARLGVEQLTTVIAGVGDIDLAVCDARTQPDVEALGLAPVSIGPVEPTARMMPLDADVDADQPMYVMVTSGSSGPPKRVVVPHRGVENRFDWMDTAFGPSAACVALQTTPHCYDSAVWQLLWPLTQGGTAVTRPHDGPLDGDELIDLVERWKVTITDLVPSVLRTMLPSLRSRSTLAPLSSLRRLVIGGEAVDASAAHEVALLFPHVAVTNLYGPTEAAIGCVHHELRPGPDELVPIGRPITNVRAFVVDPDGQQVQPGCIGEIWLAGECLALGYLADAAATAARFVPATHLDPQARRAFRTGDLGYERSDGELVFVGRADDQISVGGQLVSPAFVQRIVEGIAGVQQAAVVASGAPAPGLVAAVVARGATGDEIANRLRGLLPVQAVPRSVQVVSALPRLPNGKLDRQSILALAGSAPAGATPAAWSPLERRVAAVCRDVLGRDLGPGEDLFASGGNSLDAVRIVARLRHELAVSISFAALVSNPTVEGLAAAAGPTRLPVAPIEPADVGHDAPLSFAQQRLWFLDQLAPGNAVNHLNASQRLTGPLNRAVLARALDVAVARHEALHTRYPAESGSPRLEVLAPQAVELPVDDLTQLPAADREAAAQAILQRALLTPFDLAGEAPWRARLVAMGADEHILVLVVHHIVCDGWSLRVLAEEISETYSALAAGADPPHRPSVLQPSDLAVWERTDETRTDPDAIRRRTGARLAGLARLELPVDRSRPAMSTHRGWTEVVHLRQDTIRRLRRLAGEESATEFHAWLAVCCVFLSRLSGQDDIAVAVPVANRTEFGLERMVANVANVVVARTDLRGCPSLRVAVRRARSAALEAQADADIPFDALVRAHRTSGDFPEHPLVNALFSVQEASQDAWRLAGIDTAPATVESEFVARMDLTVDLVRARTGMCAIIVPSADLFDAPSAARLAHEFGEFADALAAAPDSALGGGEVAARLSEPVATAPTVADAGAGGILDRFLSVAAAAPDSVAVIDGFDRITYERLRLGATDLAQRLVELGASSAVPVAVCLPPGADLVRAYLAVLSIGAPYVPLDPTQPALRLGEAIAEVGAEVVIGSAGPARHEPVDLVGAGRRPVRGIAYVTFTSGTAGRPKGVTVSEHSLLALVDAAICRLGATSSDVWSMCHSPAFDLSQFELWCCLLSGGTLVTIAPALTRLPDELFEILSDEQVTIVSQTPSALAGLLDAAAGHDDNSWRPRVLVCGGEAILADLAGRARRDGWPIWNFYGPTETTVWVMARCIRVEDLEHPVVPLGDPLDHARVYVLDDRLHPRPVGTKGEICIAGPALADGYWNDPELTAERFVIADAGPLRGTRIYRTGDVGRWLANGTIAFHGRRDRQIKLRGHRIQPEEIEAALTATPGVAAARVGLRQGARATPDLVALVVTDGAGVTSAPRLRVTLLERLPSYMVPAHIHLVASLPLTVNAKLDGHRLDSAVAALVEDAPPPSVAPRTELERAIWGIWCETLGTDHIGVFDDFFESGGESIAAAVLMNRLRQVDLLDLPLRVLFEERTIDGLARRWAALRSDTGNG